MDMVLSILGFAGIIAAGVAWGAAGVAVACGGAMFFTAMHASLNGRRVS